MKNLVVINPGEDTGASQNAVGGSTAFERVRDYARRLVSPEDVVVLGSGPFENLRTAGLSSFTDAGLLAALEGISGGYESIIYVYGDCPFLDSSLTLRMLENHSRYYAEYTFADGYPYGIAPEIVRTKALPALRGLLKNPPEPLKRETLFTLIQRDINSFDLETELSPVDLRMIRASLTTDTRRNHLLCRRIAEENPADTEKITELLEKKPEILRTLPAYIGVQIVEGCPQTCFSCPYPRFGGDILSRREFMAPERFERIAAQAEEFCGDCVIGVSLWGEPSLHPRFLELCESVAGRKGLRLLVETSGIGWEPGIFSKLKDLLKDRISWIVSLDAADEETYGRLRGKGFSEAVGTAYELLRIFPGQTYVQALRMKENEEQLETFFRTWKEKTPHVIIQKYDWFCGFLEQRKVTDLSPLNRFPCRHLMRDLSVLIDGTVPLCREDLERKTPLGTIFNENLDVLWERGAGFYRDHLKKEYPDLCVDCDEYYTYNF
jgi:spiro-SPASM protein